MHPIIVIEWDQGYSTSFDYNPKLWKECLHKLFDDSNGVIIVWRKYPAMNEGK